MSKPEDAPYIDPRLIPSPHIMAESEALIHAIQSGVAADHELGSKDGAAKHLRVGINCSLCETQALARLLVFKGIIANFDEFFIMYNEVLREEKARYEAILSEKVGGPVSLA